MYQKGRTPSVFAPAHTTSYRPGVVGNELDHTDFEDDSEYSDLEEVAGRRSEDSVGKRSDTTLSSYDELQTPNHLHQRFNFQFEDHPLPMKSVEGPVGPHLFRMSQDSVQDVDLYLTMSPPVSPEETRPRPNRINSAPQVGAEAPRTSVPLRTWTPRQVAEWMLSIGFDRPIVDTFFINDISGITLIDIQYDDLKELGITSFGQRHRLWTEIKALKETKLNPTADATPFYAPGTPPPQFHTRPEQEERHCSTPESPAEVKSPASERRRVRRGRNSRDDIISPAESASIVAIEQLLPKPHKCKKGENCARWQKQQRKLARIATEFPLEMAQIEQAKASPGDSGLEPSLLGTSVVASSDLLGPVRPAIRLEENNLRAVEHRDPQENVRQFLDFQHLNGKGNESPGTPPYEMFPPLSPPKTQAPHSNLKSLPKLTIPNVAPDSHDRTALPGSAQRARVNDIYRMASPASEMDVPVTAIPIGPIERDFSSSVPPDMRFGGVNKRFGPEEFLSRSSSRAGRGPPPVSFKMPSRATSPLRRTNSASGSRRPSVLIQPLFEEAENAPTEIADDLTPTGDDDHTHAGWMKKRKTKMLRHEWQENHFRLNGSCLAMHKDERDAKAVETIDVDNYAVAISGNSSKLNSAFKRLHINGKKADPTAFAFQLTPAGDKKMAATGKTHHFAVNTSTERIDWMRELMLARARKQKDAVHHSFE